MMMIWMIVMWLKHWHSRQQTKFWRLPLIETPEWKTAPSTRLTYPGYSYVTKDERNVLNSLVGGALGGSNGFGVASMVIRRVFVGHFRPILNDKTQRPPYTTYIEMKPSICSFNRATYHLDIHGCRRDIVLHVSEGEISPKMTS